MVFSKIYLIRREPIRIKGNTGSENIISFEKSPKELEIYLKYLSSNTPKEIAKPENPRFIIKIRKSARISIFFPPDFLFVQGFPLYLIDQKFSQEI